VIADDTPIGTAVVVTRDDGRELRTTTRALPFWVITRRARKRGAKDEGRLVVFVEGIAAYYDCSRIRLASERQLELFGGRK
jgi:hypothetical protein